MTVNRNHNSATSRRRQQQIEECLYENILRTSWQSISITDICQQVGISRKAFYNYYRDKEDCLNAYIDRVLRDTVLETSQSLPDNTSSLDASISLLEHWRKNKDFLTVIKRNRLTYYLLARCLQYVQTENRSIHELLSTENIPTDLDILTCYMTIQMTLILLWHERDFDTPVEEMARKFVRLVHEPLISISSDSILPVNP